MLRRRGQCFLHGPVERSALSGVRRPRGPVAPGRKRPPAEEARARLEGFEPPTRGLEGRRSSAELQALTRSVTPRCRRGSFRPEGFRTSSACRGLTKPYEPRSTRERDCFLTYGEDGSTCTGFAVHPPAEMPSSSHRSAISHRACLGRAERFPGGFCAGRRRSGRCGYTIPPAG